MKKYCCKIFVSFLILGLAIPPFSSFSAVYPVAQRSVLSPRSCFSTLAIQAAREINRAYQDYVQKFNEITALSKQRFENKEWQKVLQDAQERLGLYKKRIDEIHAAIRKQLAGRLYDQSVWKEIKACYRSLVSGRYDWDRAQGFYDSLTRRIFGDERAVFENTEEDSRVRSAVGETNRAFLYQKYPAFQITPELIQSILTDCHFKAHYQNLPRDAGLSARAISHSLREIFGSEQIDAVEILKPLFFRNKGCYIVGRIRIRDTLVPLVFALIHNSDGIQVDAVLMDEAEIRNIFGYTRSNFHVDVEQYREMIDFLQTAMPNKGLEALYSSIGFNIMAKKETHRLLISHLQRTREILRQAKGTLGNVMFVITPLALGYVIKIIKDKYILPKAITRQGIEYQYRWVHEMDRVGRVLDGIEFRNLKLGREFFTEEMLKELLEKAPSVVVVQDGEVVIQHCYLQRKVIPLDVYFKEQTNLRALRNIVIDLGYCIKELAAAGLFTWDVKVKNFGVIGPGRVVCFDNDDLKPLENFTFCQAVPNVTCSFFVFDGGVIETTLYHDNEIDPVADIKERLGIPEAFMPLFKEVHGDLFTVNFWKEVQKRLERGEVLDSFPYPSWRRLDAVQKDLPPSPTESLIPCHAGQLLLFDFGTAQPTIEMAL